MREIQTGGEREQEMLKKEVYCWIHKAIERWIVIKKGGRGKEYRWTQHYSEE